MCCIQQPGGHGLVAHPALVKQLEDVCDLFYSLAPAQRTDLLRMTDAALALIEERRARVLGLPAELNDRPAGEWLQEHIEQMIGGPARAYSGGSAGPMTLADVLLLAAVQAAWYGRDAVCYAGTLVSGDDGAG